MAENMCFSEDIRFVGEIAEVEELLSVADVFLMPSEKESFGLAALEAMACHVPVIASNTGGLPELIQQGISGFMSNIGDTEDMAKNTLYILADENLEKFKENAIARARDFDILKILPQYEKVYEKALANAFS
jgi:glycosyltransferase involved in cell wall biosynthesis